MAPSWPRPGWSRRDAVGPTSPRPRRDRPFLSYAVDGQVDVLVEEGDQPGDPWVLDDRIGIGPGEVLVERRTDLHRPVARRALVRALGHGGRRHQQLVAHILE